MQDGDHSQADRAVYRRITMVCGGPCTEDSQQEAEHTKVYSIQFLAC